MIIRASSSFSILPSHVYSEITLGTTLTHATIFASRRFFAMLFATSTLGVVTYATRMSVMVFGGTAPGKVLKCVTRPTGCVQMKEKLSTELLTPRKRRERHVPTTLKGSRIRRLIDTLKESTVSRSLSFSEEHRLEQSHERTRSAV